MGKRDPPATWPIFDAFLEVLKLPGDLTKRQRAKINLAIYDDLGECFPRILGAHPDLNLIGHVADEVRRRWPLYVHRNKNAQSHTALGLTGQWGFFEQVRTGLDELKSMFTPWFHERMSLWSENGLDRNQAARLWLRVVGNAERHLWTKRVDSAAENWRDRLDINLNCDLRPEFIKPGVARALAALDLEAEQGGATSPQS